MMIAGLNPDHSFSMLQTFYLKVDTDALCNALGSCGLWSCFNMPNLFKHPLCMQWAWNEIAAVTMAHLTDKLAS